MEPQAIKLTPKQTRFVSEYVKNGQNATQAALKAYDTNYLVARNIGSENLTKPNVQQTIDEILNRQGMTLEANLQNVIGLGNHQPEKVSAETILKSNLELLRIRGAYPDKKSYQYSMSVKGKIKDMSYSEAQKELNTIKDELNTLEG